MGQVSGQMSLLGFDDKNNAQLNALSREILCSSEIEGVELNANSVRSSVAKRLGIEADGMVDTNNYVEGLVDIMMDAITNNNSPLSAQRLFNWHAALFPYGRSGIMKIDVADWRKGEEPMQVVSGAMGKEKVYYQAPPSEAVPAEMEQFFDWVNNSETDIVIKAAVAHFWFLTIHPFDDGNGRICRNITDMLLSQAETRNHRYFSMSAEILREKKHYYEILEATQKGNLDITDWLLWFIQCLENALSRTQTAISRTLQKAAYWEQFRLIDINERQRKVINRLWDGFDGKLTTSKWAKICHTSQDTALRDIKDLIEKGMLRISPEGGRSTNYLLP